MKLGTLADPRGVVEQEMYYARDQGFDFVEVSLEGPKCTVDQLMPKAAELRRLNGELGLFFTCHTPWGWNLATPYPDIRKATVKQVLATIDFAEATEAGLVTVHMHTRYGLYDRKELIRNMAASLTVLCDRAAKSGLAVTVENVDQGIDDLRRLFELEPRAKMHLDVGHANLVAPGGAAIHGYVDTFKDRLHHVHVHDNKGGHGVDGDLHLALGMGNVDWPKVVRSLKAAGYDKTVTFEVFGRDRHYLEHSKETFKDLWENV